jgi:MoaA/NifB/PqqE/SkfB family radical SAM enzyme
VNVLLPAPIGLLAELTHRCPLQCPYCSNPLALEGSETELPTNVWARVFREAAELGVLHVHLSGGEPAARRDLVEVTAAASSAGLYTNLITSGIATPGWIICSFRYRTPSNHLEIVSPDIAAHMNESSRWRAMLCRLDCRSRSMSSCTAKTFAEPLIWWR